jgi:hypothetical protein
MVIMMALQTPLFDRIVRTVLGGMAQGQTTSASLAVMAVAAYSLVVLSVLIASSED